MPYGGGTLPKNTPRHTPKNAFTHQKQRSWDMLDTADELRGKNSQDEEKDLNLKMF